TANGEHSTALGAVTTASGAYATALGHATQAISYASTVVGQLNQPFPGEAAYDGPGRGDWVSTEPLFVIGNGREIDANTVQRSNALVVLKNGNVGIGTGATKPAKKLVVSGNAEVTGPL